MLQYNVPLLINKIILKHHEKEINLERGTNHGPFWLILESWNNVILETLEKCGNLKKVLRLTVFKLQFIRILLSMSETVINSFGTPEW